MDKQIYLSAVLEIFFAIISGIIFIGCMLDVNKKRKMNQILIKLVLVNMIMNLIDACLWIWYDAPGLLILMKVLSFVSYVLGCVIFGIFAHLIIYYIDEHISVPRWIKCGIQVYLVIMIFMWFISIFNGMYYYWDENGICQIGKYFWLSQLFGIVLLVGCILLVLYYCMHLRKKDCVVFIFYSVLPLSSYGITIGLDWEVTPLYGAITMSIFLYYIILHVEHGHQIVEQETKLLKQELELVSNRTAIMLSQIQPHFLYNTLTAIAQLCEKNPKKAKETTINFSEYLRHNMNSLTKKTVIPFSEELKHLETYLSIEQMRFGDSFSVIYEIKAKHFMLPALSVQPIVENAVKHGVCQKEEDGIVTIKTEELEDCFEIIVEDDGVGFDVKEMMQDGKIHVGLENVKERLQIMSHATLNIKSKIDVGTIVTIHIPKEEQHENTSGR